MAEDLPFQVEYAKSGRASCKGCKTNIPQGSLRIAVMVQSAFFDGKQPNWHHETCFFGRQRPTNVGDIGNYSSLRYDDQERLKTTIENCGSAVLPVTKGKKSKATKRPNSDDKLSLSALKDFAVEYSKSSRAGCKVCEIKITKGEVRISKKVFDTEIGQKYGGQALWHHVKCFVETRSELMYFAGGELLPGFNSLTKEDKIMIKKELPALKQDEVPVKKLKEEPKDEGEQKKVEKKEKLLQEQNKLVFKYRDNLQGNMNKNEMRTLMTYNKQEPPTSLETLLDVLADVMAFGALKPCDVCKKGQFALESNGYKCTGNLTEWTKCQNVTKTPERVSFRIPSDMKGLDMFKRYKCKPTERVFRDIAPTVVIKSEQELQKPKTERPPPPLKNLEFFIYGLSTKSKEETKIKILKLGGRVVSKMVETLAAVVSTDNELGKMSDKMESFKQLDVQIIEKSFFDNLKKDATVANSIELITEKNIAPWGSDPKSRIPKDVVDGKSTQKSASSLYSKASSGVTKLTLKGGSAVDPDSGVDDIAHVYKDSHGAKYSVVLGLTDVVSKKNSYYKLQVLEADDKKKKRYWMFRSWGRIGTTIGGNKLESFGHASSACDKFEELFKEKTENSWEHHGTDSFQKVAGRMYPIDIDYGDDKPLKKIEDSDIPCLLPKPVQHLIKMIFDVEVMNKVMLEFELDTEKMPLGKLSRKQLMSGYKVLTELTAILSDENKTEKTKMNAAKITDATNRFYTLIPHDFGINNPPLLNDDETIKTKILMLDNLLELQIAYSMIQSGSEKGGASPLDTHFIQLKSEIEPVVISSPEYEMAKKYVMNTHAKTHSMYELEIVQLFKVKREGEEKRFKPFRKLPNRRLLWHGSRVTNFAGILSQGLRIAPPEAPVTGYMFGKGIYFADMVSKSANYCSTSVSNPVGVLLLCEVALGKMKELQNSEYVTELPQGTHSVKGVGRTQPDPKQDLILDCGTIVPLGTPVESKEKTSLLYNEFIVYDVAQVNVKYLFQMKFNYKY